GRRAVLPFRRRDDVAAQLAGHELGAVADAEDGNPPRPDAGVRLRRVRVVDGVRAAGEDDRLRVAALDLRPRRVVGDELGVDVELADPPGDQLGELAAEVEDDDRIGLADIGPIIRGPGRSGRLEGRLEIRLDLGVVRSEDAMTGVRRLAVDRLAALAGRCPSRRSRWLSLRLPPASP